MSLTYPRSVALVCLLMLLSLVVLPGARAGTVSDRVKATGTVRVCIWPEYYGITFRNPRTQQLEGMDVDLSTEMGLDLKVAVKHIDSSFATFIDDLKSGRCDVAMFAVGMLPLRMAQVAFTRPYMQSDIYGITTKGNRVISRWEDIDRPGVSVAVQAGTFMEPVMASTLKSARLVTVRPPNTRERELEAGRVDVFMADFPYSQRLLANADWATLIAPPRPFHVVPYAYAVKLGDSAWLAAVDDFVARIQRDGRLSAAARQHGLQSIVRLN